MKAELQPAEVDPSFKKKKKLGGGVKKKVTATRNFFMPNPPERTFEM